MEMEIIVLGVSHYDMTKDGGEKGSSIRIIGDSVNTNFYFGAQVSESPVPYEELTKLANVTLPAAFNAKFKMGSVKKNGSKKEVPTIEFYDLKYKHTVSFAPVKSA